MSTVKQSITMIMIRRGMFTAVDGRCLHELGRDLGCKEGADDQQDSVVPVVQIDGCLCRE